MFGQDSFKDNFIGVLCLMCIEDENFQAI